MCVVFFDYRYGSFDWLEYSLKTSAAYCMACRIFAVTTSYLTRPSSRGGHFAPDPAFTTRGFKTWNRALETFKKHEESVAHRHAVHDFQQFLTKKPVLHQVNELAAQQEKAHASQVEQNRNVMRRLFSITRLLGRLCLPFRGHVEQDSSGNKGTFVEFVIFLANHGDSVLKHHLEFAPKNAHYLSPATQNELISLLGDAVQTEIIREVKEAGFFTILMDETLDFAGVDQVIFLIRYISPNSHEGQATIQERVVALATLIEGKTGEELEELLLNTLENLGLDLYCVVGQCYDGGGNLAGCYKGVQARILARNALALYTHCYAHSLNRVLVNSVNHQQIVEARNFFSAFEHMIVFIGRSGPRQAYFLKVQDEATTEVQVQDQEVDEIRVEEEEDVQNQPSTSTQTKKKRAPKTQ